MNRQETPTFKDLVFYCGESGKALIALDNHLKNECRAEGIICFPYGRYGWCVRYSRKNKRICDIFPENGAFVLHMRILHTIMNAIYCELSVWGKEAWNNRTKCKKRIRKLDRLSCPAHGAFIRYRKDNRRKISKTQSKKSRD